MIERCKVLGCNNSVTEIKRSARDENMKDVYGYCQIHYIDGLVEESEDGQ